MNKSYKFLVKTNTCSLGYKNQTVCSNEMPFAVEDLYEKVTNLFTVKYLINKGFWCFEEEIIGIWENPAYKI